MATDTATAPKEKNFKEKFLDMVNEKYGVAGAAAMEDLLKNHQKQTKDAMIDKGMPITEMAKKMGMDISDIDNKAPLPEPAPQSNAPAMSMANGDIGNASGQSIPGLEGMAALRGLMQQQAQGQPAPTGQTSPTDTLKQALEVVPARSAFDTGDIFTKDGKTQISGKGSLVKVLEFLAKGSFGESASEQAKNIEQAKFYGTGKPNAWLDFSKEMAGPIAEAAMSGDLSGYMNADRRTKTVVASILAEHGIKADDLVLGYGAEKTAMNNVKLQQQKVDAGNSAQVLLDAGYNSKTGKYMIPPSQHAELAISVARLLSNSGTIPYEMVQELRQRTAKEGISGALIYLGMDPKEIGGSTQSVIENMAKLVKRETLQAQSNVEKYKQGQTPTYIGSVKEGTSTSETPSTGKKSAWERLQEIRSK